VQAAIGAIEDDQQRDEAQVYWEFSTVINWSHPMTQALIALAGPPLRPLPQCGWLRRTTRPDR
jgi:hypothetical protein